MADVGAELIMKDTGKEESLPSLGDRGGAVAPRCLGWTRWSVGLPVESGGRRNANIIAAVTASSPGDLRSKGEVGGPYSRYA